MKAQDIIKTVADTLQQRGVENGYDSGEERSAAAIAELFNAKTGHNLSEADAWSFLICLKEVRLRRQLLNGSNPTDTLIDLVSYQALLAECESQR